MRVSPGSKAVSGYQCARWLRATFVGTLLLLAAGVAHASCPTGAYRSDGGDFVVIAAGPSEEPSTQRYLFRDGRRGKVGDEGGPASCADEIAVIHGVPWPRVPTTERLTTFPSDGAKLRGKLIEPARGGRRPLVVMVHGSERTSAVATSIYPYVLVAQGISVFVYDKRGTGGSEGEYTQNFELLGDDAAAALATARTMAAGHFNRAGFFGGSQGGWVAPLAATHSGADFVAVGFGLVASPVDEDLEQMLSEAKAAGYGPDVVANIVALSKATDTLVASHFSKGFETLEKLRRAHSGQPWVKTIDGEYSGDMLRTTDADLRRIGQARFDNLELIWHYDAVAVLRNLKVPLLWVLAADDREAPIVNTRKVLIKLVGEGRPIDLFLFPKTEHGMYEYETLPDGSRRATHVTDGYFRLLADWIKDSAAGTYGRGERLCSER
ncbi:MAG: alpha/beta fold hydrolase [Sphingomonadaceae bacterium]|nr:alpha/beta fold hydrolase [Sphingomonadaceae bacterium]